MEQIQEHIEHSGDESQMCLDVRLHAVTDAFEIANLGSGYV